MTKGKYERTEAYRAVMSAALKGRHLSAEHRARISASMRRETVSYSGVHYRLRAERGLAREYPCADNCGEQAVSWAYKEPHGFSVNLDDYRPLCWPCHMQRDLSTKETP
jgi:hypothetical protein